MFSGLITPPGSSIFHVTIIKNLFFIDIFLFKNTSVNSVTVTIPRPPICINNSITISPSILNCDPISTGDKPVTVNALEAINRASKKILAFTSER